MKTTKRQFSPEHIAKLRLAARGRVITPAARRKISAALKGTRRTGALRRCKRCDADFYIEKHVLSLNGKGVYCSASCRSSMPKNISRYKTPKPKRIRNSLEYIGWRTAVFKRDNHTCQDCGERGGYLEADHVMPFCLFPDLRLEVLNGRTLCEECHEKQPKYQRKSERAIWI